MKAIAKYLKEYFSDFKVSEITFKGLAGAAKQSSQNQ